MIMKKMYCTPDVELLKVQAQDVITASLTLTSGYAFDAEHSEHVYSVNGWFSEF